MSMIDTLGFHGGKVAIEGPRLGLRRQVAIASAPRTFLAMKHSTPQTIVPEPYASAPVKLCGTLGRLAQFFSVLTNN